MCEGSLSKELSQQKCVVYIYLCSKITDEDRLGEGWINGGGGVKLEVEWARVLASLICSSLTRIFSAICWICWDLV